MSKIVLIGCGNVGMAYAYALTINRTKVNELVLVDINKNKAEGEALDLMHASSACQSQMKIKAGDYKDCSGADIIVIAAGKNQDVGETRTDLINKNYSVFKSIISEVKKTKFNGIFLIATNPLDVMTYITFKLSGVAPEKVIGSGTTLDTARLRHILGGKLAINPKNIHAYVIGEHGDSEMIPWSNVTVGLNDATGLLSDNDRENILKEVRNSAYEIINKKGNTAYGIGICLLNLTNAILDDSNSIFTVSAYNIKHDIYFGMPSVINAGGVKSTFVLDLTKEEKAELDKSIACIKENIKTLK